MVKNTDMMCYYKNIAILKVILKDGSKLIALQEITYEFISYTVLLVLSIDK